MQNYESTKAFANLITQHRLSKPIIIEKTKNPKIPIYTLCSIESEMLRTFSVVSAKELIPFKIFLVSPFMSFLKLIEKEKN